MTPSLKPGPMAGADRGAYPPRDKHSPPGPTRPNRSPVEVAFDRLCMNTALGSDAKVIATQLALYCLADLNVSCFPSTLELARFAGWASLYEDRGKARTLAALAELEAAGYIARLNPGRFWAWFRAEATKFGVVRPKIRQGCRRFIVLLWKFLGDRPDFGAFEGRAGATFAEQEGCAGATHKDAPAHPPEGAPAHPTMNGSNLEPTKGTGDEQNVTALTREEGPQIPAAEPPPERGPSEADVARWLVEARNPRVKFVQWSALWSLEDAGRLPVEWIGKVPPRPVPVAAAVPRAEPTVTLSPAELLDNRIRRLAGGEALDGEAIADLAFDLAMSIFDPGSKVFHAQVLAALAAGKIKLETYMIGLRKARKAPKGVGGREFTTFIEPYRPGYEDRKRKKRPPAGCVLPTHRRAALTNASH